MTAEIDLRAEWLLAAIYQPSELHFAARNVMARSFIARAGCPVQWPGSPWFELEVTRLTLRLAMEATKKGIAT